MKPGYTVEHIFSHNYLGGIHDTAHIINNKKTNTVYVAYFTDGYMPEHNEKDTVAIFKIKPKSK